MSKESNSLSVDVSRIPYETLGPTFPPDIDPVTLAAFGAEALRAANIAQPELRWGKGISVRGELIKVTLPHPHFSNSPLEESFIEGELDPEREGRRRLVGLRMQVSPWLRGNGFGDKLMRSLVGEAIDHGATEYMTFVASQYALKIRGDIFGQENIAILDDLDEENISLTFEEAMELLKQNERDETDLEYRKLGVVTCVDLTTIDTDKWERPVPQLTP